LERSSLYWNMSTLFYILSAKNTPFVQHTAGTRVRHVMHELGIARSIVDIVREESSRLGLRPKTVELKIGSLSDVVPQALDFALEAATADNELTGVRFKTSVAPTTMKCRACEATFEVNGPDFTCVTCGLADVDLVSGQELEVSSIEFWEEDTRKAGDHDGENRA